MTPKRHKCRTVPVSLFPNTLMRRALREETRPLFAFSFLGCMMILRVRHLRSSFGVCVGFRFRCELTDDVTTVNYQCMMSTNHFILKFQKVTVVTSALRVAIPLTAAHNKRRETKAKPTPYSDHFLRQICLTSWHCCVVLCRGLPFIPFFIPFHL